MVADMARQMVDGSGTERMLSIPSPPKLMMSAIGGGRSRINNAKIDNVCQVSGQELR